MKFGLGVVIGKFLPPHRGHKFLIDTAIAQCERVTVIICEKTTDVIPGELRRQWMSAIHPAAEVMVIDDRYDENDSRVWAENTIRWLGRPPDVVFTSEDYGDAYAGYLGCRHVLVDRARATIPCSGTAIRKDPYACWDFIEPPVRGWFAKRICALGAESTGTTTIAHALAEHYHTPWVAEYGREYSEQKYAKGIELWTSDEFVHIAGEQCRREDAAACLSNRLLICDTNAFATTLWHRRYMGGENPGVAEIAATMQYDLYLLTGDEIPFVQDGLRDGEHIRHEMHQWFVSALEKQPVPWITLSGPHETRLKTTVQAINGLFRESQWRPPIL